MAEFDMSEAQAFAARLVRSAGVTRTVARGVANTAGMKIGRQMQTEARPVQGGRIADSITYDVVTTPSGVSVEVGPARHTAGGLAFFYYGNSKIGPRIPDPIGALRTEAESTARWWLKGVGDAL